MIHKSSVISIITFLVLIQLSVYSQNPPNLHWKKIDTEHFEIVFPKELTSNGQKVASLMEYIYSPVSKSLKAYPKKISLFLYNQSSISNGYVSLAPRYMAWYTTPLQNSVDLAGEDWFQTLALHEFRHNVQFEKQDQNFTRFAKYFFGDYALAGLSIWSTPLWFDEGDAVFSETTLSNGGRGRLPSFNMHIRSLLSEKKVYSYDKAYLGSYKDFYPNYYYLGYLLTTHVNRNYGIDMWSNILDRVTKFSFSPFSFSGSLKKRTGSNLRKTYLNAMTELDSMWDSQALVRDLTDFEIIKANKTKAWTNYYDPQTDEKGNIIARKYGLSNPSTLVSIDNKGVEKKIVQLDPDDRISVGNSKVVWNSFFPDIRWNERNYSDIYIFDLLTKNLKRLTFRQKYFAPALSKDGNKIAVVEYTTDMTCTLHILDVQNGKKLKSFSFPAVSFMRMPSWSDDGQEIIFTQTSGQDKAISIVNTENGELKNILTSTTENFSRPVFYKNYVLFNSIKSGIDEIHAINCNSNKRFVVVTSKFGCFNPSISNDGKYLLFQDYSSKGHAIARIIIDTLYWKEVPDTKPELYFDKVSESEGLHNVFNSGPDTTKKFQVTDYPRFKNAFNIHSWAILPNLQGLSLMLFSRDKLNTTQISAGLNYFKNEGKTNESVSFRYSGFFPVLSLGIDYGNRSINETVNDKVETYNWDENNLNGSIEIPLDLSQGIFSNTLQLIGGYSFTKVMNKENPYLKLYEQGNGTLSTVFGQLIFSSYKASAIKDLQPRFGQDLIAIFKTTPFNSDYQGTLTSINFSQYLPGLFRHHGISLQASYEQQIPSSSAYYEYHYLSQILFVRGYDYQFHKTFYKGSVNYKLPLLYPDLALGSVFYFKRINVNLFYDYGQGTGPFTDVTYKSFGAEFTTDFHIFRLPIPLNIGVRISNRLYDNKLVTELVFMGQ